MPKKLYKCKECELIYKDKKLAEKCERWCKEHKSCNLKITKYAVNKKIVRNKNGKKENN